MAWPVNLSSLGPGAVHRGVRALRQLNDAGDWQWNFIALAYGDPGALRSAVEHHQDYHADVGFGWDAQFFRIVGDIPGLGSDALELYYLSRLQPSRLRTLAAFYLLRDLLLVQDRARVLHEECERLVDEAAEMLRDQRCQEAATWLTRVLSLNPNHYCACTLLAIAFGGLGLHDEAIRTSERLVGLAPNTSEADMRLGDSLLMARCYPEAIRAIQEACRLGSGDAHAYHALGIAYCGLGMLDNVLEQAVILDDLEPSLTDTLRALLAQGQ